MRITHRAPWGISAALLCWFGLIVLLMVRAMRLDPGPTGLPGDLPNVHNRTGDLSSILLQMSLELLVLTVILRPWSYYRSWGRALTALVLCIPWTLIFMALLIHAGSVMVLHVVWLIGILLGTACLTVISANAARRHRAHTTAAAA
jgi:hypothetical protein